MVEVSSKLVVDHVENEWIDGRVDEHETESSRLEHVPVGAEADVAVMPADQIDVTR